MGLGSTAWPERKASLHYDETNFSQPTFPVRMEHHRRVPMRDGVKLSADIYRPDAEGRFPAVLVRTPYNNSRPYNVARARFYAERGYVVVLQDTRGRYDSDGKFYPFRHEPSDGYDTDEWIGRQTWSNGKIGTMGGSYVGFTQLSQAIQGSPYLAAMVPKVFTHLPILTTDSALGRHSLHYRDWVQHPTRDTYWDENSFENSRHQISVPILNITGWYDIFLVGLLRDHVEMRTQAKTALARNNKRIMVGPWVHSLGSRSNIRLELHGERNLDFGPEAEVDLQSVELRWFDYWLKGMDNGTDKEPPVKIFVMGENYWRYEKEWPLARTQYTKYYFRSGGRANSLYGDGTLSLPTLTPMIRPIPCRPWAGPTVAPATLS